MQDREEDTIEFRIISEKTVINDTVKIIANVTAMVNALSNEATLRASIREMMNAFIGDASWQFGGLSRIADESGYEKVTLVASARVPETENYALDKRRQEASRPDQGLAINRVTPDISSPSSLIEETERWLRADIVRKAREDCDLMSKAMARTCRIKSISYRSTEVPNYANVRASATLSAIKQSYGSTFSDADGDDTLANAQKLTMTADIILAVQAG